ncbi:MAG: GAF domain-containing protein, partial [Gammaproteobacteria bacterium]|nr:GAF domain-containing protein [Gammaproteobacteria bacterium]
MRIRSRLLFLVIFLSLALLVNLLAMGYLVSTVTRSSQTVQDVSVRQQAVALQMQAQLRDAEAALYRYQIEGEAGFVAQFENQLNLFDQEIATFQSLALTDKERAWADELSLAHQDAVELGAELIALRDQQTADLQTMESLQANMADQLAVLPSNPASQQATNDMWASLREMSLAVNTYLASSHEGEKLRFSETAVAFNQAYRQYQELTNGESSHFSQDFANLQAIGSRLIGEQDNQQALFAQFAAVLFHIGQQVIVGEIQPQAAQNLAQAQADLNRTLTVSMWISLATAVTATLLAVAITTPLLRQMESSLQRLLHGADRVAAGDLSRPVPVAGQDEFNQLARTFNEMMTDLSAREHRLQARIAEMEVLRQVSLQLTSTLDLNQVLDTIANSALSLVNATEVRIFLGDAQADPLQFGVSARRDSSHKPFPRPPRVDGLVATAARTGQPQVISQADQHPLFSAPGARHWGIRAAAAFPLQLAGRVLGVFNAALDDRDSFREDELRIMRLLSDQAAVALENARLYQSVADKETRLNALVQKLALVQENERRLVGLDLHDGLTQILLSANMHLNTFAALAKIGDEPADAELSLVRMRLQESIREVRWVVSELRPTELEDFGLVDGLRQYATKVAQAQKWQLTFATDLDAGLMAPAVETAVFRIVQEALTNIRKHAYSKRVSLSLATADSCLTIQVQDWGAGFDVNRLGGENTHLGLVGMQER